MKLYDFKLKVKHLIDKNKTELKADENGIMQFYFPAEKEIKEFLSKSYWICGKTGTGKTFIAKKINNNFADADMISWFDLVNQYSQDNENNLKAKDRKYFSTDRMLIIDDLGSTRLNETNIGLLFALIDYRISNDLPTMITTNYSPTELEEKILTINPKLSETIISRIKGRFEIIIGNGKDLRLGDK